MPGRGAAGIAGITGRGVPSLATRSARGGTTGRAAGCPASVRTPGADAEPVDADGKPADCADAAGAAPGRTSGRGRWITCGRGDGPGMAAPGPEVREPSADGAELCGNGWRGPERICPGRGPCTAAPGRGLALGGAGRPGAITATGGMGEGAGCRVGTGGTGGVDNTGGGGETDVTGGAGGAGGSNGNAGAARGPCGRAGAGPPTGG
jgi:hypothetical protein